MGADSFHLCAVEPLPGAQVIAIVDKDGAGGAGEGWAPGAHKG